MKHSLSPLFVGLALLLFLTPFLFVDSSQETIHSFKKPEPILVSPLKDPQTHYSVTYENTPIPINSTVFKNLELSSGQPISKKQLDLIIHMSTKRAKKDRLDES